MSLRFVLLYSCFLLLWVPTQAWGQTHTGVDFDRFEPLTCSGEIPQSFLEWSSVKAERDRQEEAVRAEKRSEMRIREEFVLSSNFIIDEMMHSGKVLFNDPVSQYVNQIADTLLRDFPELRSQLEFYVVKSPAVNAFTCHQGIVFVNIGLIAKLENEAQLAFVLAHEIQHYKEKHTIDQYVEVKKIQKGKGDYAGLSFDERILESSKYSKQNETDADIEGLKLFLQSDYSRSAPDGACDVLARSWRPISEAPFDPAFIELPTFRFPQSYYCDSLTPVELEEDYDDARFSHPNIASRREALQAELEKAGATNGGKPYLIGESAFQEVRKICQYEMAWLYLEAFAYEHALYHTSILMQDNPDSYFLNKVTARALYGLAKYKNENSFSEVHISSAEIAGEAQHVFCMMESAWGDELTALALAHCWKLQKKYPEDPVFPMLTRDLCDDLAWFHPLVLSRVMNPDRPLSANELETRIDETLVPLLLDPELLKIAHQAQSDVDAKWQLRKTPEGQKLRARWNNRFEMNAKSNRLTDASLEQVTFVRPLYKIYKDKSWDRKVQFLEGENRTREFREVLKTNSEKLDLDARFLTIAGLQKEEVDRFNQLVLLEQWKNETILRGEVEMVPLNADKLRILKQELGTEHFAWSYVIKVTDVPDVGQRILYLIGFGIWGVPVPFGIYKAVSNRNEALKITFVLNSETFEHEFFELVMLRQNDNRAFLKSNAYHTLNQFKKQP